MKTPEKTPAEKASELISTFGTKALAELAVYEVLSINVVAMNFKVSEHYLSVLKEIKKTQ